MNIVCFPVGKLEIGVLRQVLLGGVNKMREAGVVLLGGHSVDDPELKYGLSVTGVLHPNKVVFNNTEKPGDKLILTKRLGTGIISTAIKAGKAGKNTIKMMTNAMATLNRAASEVMMSVGVHACTDITGFGFLGHAGEMLEDSGVGLEIESSAIPYFPEARDFAEKGFLPGGLGRNSDYRKSMVEMGPGVPKFLAEILYDPQTSGGLLIAVAARKANRLLAELHEAGVEAAAVVGKVIERPAGKIIVR